MALYTRLRIFLLGLGLGAAFVVSPLTLLAQNGGIGRLYGATGVAAGGIVAFNPDGTNLINLTANTTDHGAVFPSGQGSSRSSNPSVSRNGKIAFQSNRDGTGAHHLFVMNSDGSGLRQLTFLPSDLRGFDAGNWWDFKPVISPDGTKVAFLSRRGGLALTPPNNGILDLFIVNTDGTGLRQVTTTQINTGGGPAGSAIYAVAWDPTSTKLVFAGLRHHNNAFRNVISTIHADGTNETVLYVLTQAGDLVDWSSNGRLLCYVNNEGEGFLKIHDFKTGVRTVIPSALTANFGSFMRFTPDNTRIAFRNGVTGNVDLINLDGSNRTVLPLSGLNLSTSEPFWFTSGPPIPTPARLELAPAFGIITPNSSLQVRPTLRDGAGNILSRAATAWTTLQTAVSIDGRIVPNGTTGFFTLTAKNGGLTGTMDYMIGVPRIQTRIIAGNTFRSGGEVFVSLAFKNAGTGDATTCRLTRLTLNGVLTLTALPRDISSRLGVGSEVSVFSLRFPASVGVTGTTATLSLGGDFKVGTFSQTLRFTLP